MGRDFQHSFWPHPLYPKDPISGSNGSQALQRCVVFTWLFQEAGSRTRILVRAFVRIWPSSLLSPSCSPRLPLCLLRDLSKLAFSSLFGLACETWWHPSSTLMFDRSDGGAEEAGVVVFMLVRLCSGEYAVGGDFYDSQEITREWMGVDGSGRCDRGDPWRRRSQELSSVGARHKGPTSSLWICQFLC